jgi:hypothetical protein
VTVFRGGDSPASLAKLLLLGPSFHPEDRVKAKATSHLETMGDANTKLFHARANGCGRKVYIQSLTLDSGTTVTTKDKEEILVHHFKSILGSSAH